MKFRIGQIVTCIDNVTREDEFTVNKQYAVLDSREGALCIENDNGSEAWSVAERFERYQPQVPEAPATQVVANESVYMFDVDDTLVMWDMKFNQPGEGRVEIQDPYDGATVWLKPHTRHVKLLTQMAGRGRFVVVWSQGGAQWAHAVVKALCLEQHVNLIMTKPAAYVDDLPCNAWMKERIYLDGKETQEESA